MMDEPLGALDSEFRELMCQELRALHDRLQATTVYVTHDQIEAMAMADTIAIMNQGVIEQLGAPQEVYDRPASVFVADFIGSPSMNFLPFDGGYAAGARPGAPRRRRAGRAGAARGRAGARAAVRRAARARALRAAPRRCAPRCWAPSTWAPARSSPARPRRARRCAPRSACDVPAQRGDQVGLAFDATQVSLFDQASGRALRTARHDAAPRTRARHGAARSRPWLSCAARPRQALRRRARPCASLNLDVASGEFIVLLGPSGAGKTTTLRLVAGLETARRRPGAHRRPRRDARSRRRCAT